MTIAPIQTDTHRLLRYTVLLYLVIFSAYFQSCVPEKSPESNTPFQEIDFRNPEIQNNWNFVDQRNIDSLHALLISENPTLRLLALRGLNTIQDSALLSRAPHLLKDPNPQIASAAAFAIGQGGNASSVISLTESFVSNDSIAEELVLNKLLLEALGKLGDHEVENMIATVSTYKSVDSALIEGQVRALYQFALRGISSSKATDRIISILKDTSMANISRLMAAHYLGKSASLDLADYDEDLRMIGFEDKDPYIRMAIATGFKHIQSDFGFQSLIDWLSIEKDDRVRANLLRSILKYPDKPLLDVLLLLINEKNGTLSILAAKSLMDHLTRKDAVIIRRKARNMANENWRIKANLYAAANRFMSNRYRISKVNMNNEIEDHYRQSKNVYQKSAYIRAWSQYAANLDKLIQEYKSSKSEVVKSAILENLFETTSEESINKVYYGMQRTARRKVRDLIMEAVASGNSSAIAQSSDFIERHLDIWRPYFSNFDFLQTGIDKLILPRDYESHLSASKLLHTVTVDQQPFTTEKIKYNHPIDWTIIDDLRDTVMVQVNTTKGSFRCHLYPQVAPGAVTNFLQLVVSGFYTDKAFHRVVPNFVIQTGCPIGNGYGSLDYSIRSEFSSLRYDKEGVMGMASVGPDTEGTQWFVTHSPSPHIDGKYTIFGQVIGGMDVVHTIMVGDKIESIKVFN